MFGYYGYYYDYTYFIFMLPALIISLWAQFKVKTTFDKFSHVSNSKGLTGAQAAYRVLADNGITNVKIERISGSLSDHYDPKTNVIRLSETVYGSTSVSAIGVAAHEAGHAVQEAEKYAPMKFRAFLVPATNIGSSLSMPLIIAGLLIPTYYQFFVQLGILFFSLSVLFQLVTLPVEFNASRRAIRALESGNLLYDQELDGAKKVLKAAAMTYLAASITAILSLIRLILIYGRRRDQD